MTKLHQLQTPARHCAPQHSVKTWPGPVSLGCRELHSVGREVDEQIKMVDGSGWVPKLGENNSALSKLLCAVLVSVCWPMRGRGLGRDKRSSRGPHL